jgi:peptidoglycan/xylan/chitin deacetylase (PgdA/CDA1 family)
MKGIWRRDSDRGKWLVESLIGLLMLPLTLVPIWWYLSHTSDGYLLYLKGRYQLLPPATPGLSPRDRAVAVADRRVRIHGVPILVYHGVGPESFSTPGSDGRFTLPRGLFAAQMQSLRAAGYAAITPAQLAEYLSTGSAAGLPAKPVLITFDDGRTDAMLQADRILQDTGMKATMFVIGATSSRGGFYYEQAGSLRSFASNGRWTLESHTFDLHHLVATGGVPKGALVALGRGESLRRYRVRIGADLDREDAFLQSLGSQPVAFAYPFSDYGQWGSAALRRSLRDVLAPRYRLAFDQDEQSGWTFALPGDDPLHIHRLEVRNWSGPQLLHRLDAAARLTDVEYDARGLDARYSARQLVLAALAQPRCTAGGVVRSRAVPAREKLVAIGFDDGPSQYTPQVLDLLARYRAHATFFEIGEQISGHERLLQRILVAGDELGNHTWTHPHPAKLTTAALRAQLARTTGELEAAMPGRVCLFRPPYGEEVPRLSHLAARLGLRTVLWSVDPSDYALRSPREIARRVLARVRPGSIVVLHDGGADRSPTVQALPRILSTLRGEGYRVVTITELLHASAPDAGVVAPVAPSE